MKLVGCEDDNTYGVVFMQSEGKKPGGIPRCKQEYNIRMDLKECSRSWSGLGKAERNWHPPSTMSLAIDFTWNVDDTWKCV